MLVVAVCIIPLAIVLWKLWWIRNAALVCLTYGPGAYFHGMRVAPGNPQKFSDGQLVPVPLDLVSIFIYFFVVAFGFIFLLVLGVFACEKFRRGRNAA